MAPGVSVGDLFHKRARQSGLHDEYVIGDVRDMALRGLQHAERWVVEQYYFQNRSMKQIGDDLNLSESRICQIHSQVIELLKRKFRAYSESCEL